MNARGIAKGPNSTATTTRPIRVSSFTLREVAIHETAAMLRPVIPNMTSKFDNGRINMPLPESRE
jgi:hypothetical protein